MGACWFGDVQDAGNERDLLVAGLRKMVIALRATVALLLGEAAPAAGAVPWPAMAKGYETENDTPESTAGEGGQSEGETERSKPRRRLRTAARARPGIPLSNRYKELATETDEFEDKQKEPKEVYCEKGRKMKKTAEECHGGKINDPAIPDPAISDSLRHASMDESDRTYDAVISVPAVYDSQRLDSVDAVAYFTGGGAEKEATVSAGFSIGTDAKNGSTSAGNGYEELILEDDMARGRDELDAIGLLYDDGSPHCESASLEDAIARAIEASRKPWF